MKAGPILRTAVLTLSLGACATRNNVDAVYEKCLQNPATTAKFYQGNNNTGFCRARAQCGADIFNANALLGVTAFVTAPFFDPHNAYMKSCMSDAGFVSPSESGKAFYMDK